jgi:hypothetical protein
VGTFIALVLVVLAYVIVKGNIDAKRKREAIARRRQALFDKYGDAEIVDRIMARSYWQGQTSDQLSDSLGSPVDVDRKILKTKSKEVWKYLQTGKGRFGLRITLENDIVVGWEERT